MLVLVVIEELREFDNGRARKTQEGSEDESPDERFKLYKS